MAKDNINKSKIIIPVIPENIVPKESIKFLGVQLSDNLNWKRFLVEGKGNLLSQLKTEAILGQNLMFLCPDP